MFIRFFSRLHCDALRCLFLQINNKNISIHHGYGAICEIVNLADKNSHKFVELLKIYIWLLKV